MHTRVFVERSKAWVYKFDVHRESWGRIRDTIPDTGQSDAELRIYEASLMARLKDRAERPVETRRFREYVALYRAEAGDHAKISIVRDLERDLGDAPMGMVGKRFEAWIEKQTRRKVKKWHKDDGEMCLFTLDRRLSASTLQAYRRYYKAICGFATSWQCPAHMRLPSDKNPSSGLAVGAVVKRQRAITPAERKRYTDAAQSVAPWILPALDYSRHMPIRPADLIALTVDCLDLMHGQIVYTPGKTAKTGTQATPLIPPEMHQYFRDRIGDRECNRLFFHINRWSGRREPITMAGLDSAHGRICAAAGITNLRWYDWRHDAVNWCLHIGMSESDIMQVAGWKTNMVNHYNTRDRVRLAERGMALLKAAAASDAIRDTA